MPMVSASATARIVARLQLKGFNLDEVPFAKDYLEAIVEEIITEVKLATVVVTVVTPSAGAGTGVIT